MALDGKYGRVTLERGDIGEDEPVVVFRAQDALLPKVLDWYATECLKAGSPRHHVDLVLGRIPEIEAWQANHHTQIPQSKDFQ